MHFKMLEVVGEGEAQEFVERTLAIAKDKIEGVVELSPERCMIFTANKQVLVKADYLETVGELNNNG